MSSPMLWRQHARVRRRRSIPASPGQKTSTKRLARTWWSYPCDRQALMATGELAEEHVCGGGIPATTKLSYDALNYSLEGSTDAHSYIGDDSSAIGAQTSPEKMRSSRIPAVPDGEVDLDSDGCRLPSPIPSVRLMPSSHWCSSATPWTKRRPEASARQRPAGVRGYDLCQKVFLRNPPGTRGFMCDRGISWVGLCWDWWMDWGQWVSAQVPLWCFLTIIFHFLFELFNLNFSLNSGSNEFEFGTDLGWVE